MTPTQPKLFRLPFQPQGNPARRISLQLSNTYFSYLLPKIFESTSKAVLSIPTKHFSRRILSITYIVNTNIRELPLLLIFVILDTEEVYLLPHTFLPNNRATKSVPLCISVGSFFVFFQNGPSVNSFPLPHTAETPPSVSFNRFTSLDNAGNFGLFTSIG